VGSNSTLDFITSPTITITRYIYFKYETSKCILYFANKIRESMQVYTHWEWRGFGAVSPRFAKQFLALPSHLSRQRVDDRYIWAPGLNTNIKFRTGAEDGLKFKRLEALQEPFEKWRENPDEIFDLPLNKNQWELLADDLKRCGINMPAYDFSYCNNRTALQEMLNSVGCKLIDVKKERAARYIEYRDVKIAIEWAVLSSPVKTVSIGLENITQADDEVVISALDHTMVELGLTTESMRTASYLNMLNDWAEQ